ncbi:hypothetical protein [Streptomyces sp.]|uniref:hypothetical protein n=1 Tax=Streptomyces sp. TaxID=1931 RepID=UPI002810A7E6|nr:hypothetical protein [Streptomyces sp.]
MSDAIRRPGGEPLPGSTGTTPGAPAAGGEGPLVAAHPQAGGTPAGDTARHAPERTPGPGRGNEGTPGTRLLPRDDGDRFAAQLQHAVAGFVDAPRDAVEEADRVLQELTARVTDAVTERRHALCRSWRAADTADTGEAGNAAATDTEQLRLALRDYRELAERLLRV